MAHVTYVVVQHDGGWAYKVGDVFSETFPTRALAHQAATIAAREQRAPDSTVTIEYEDTSGQWHDERSEGTDRPETEVKD